MATTSPRGAASPRAAALVEAPTLDERALRALYASEHARVVRLARRLALHPEDALDLAQRTFVRVLDAVRRNRVPMEAGALRAYLAATAVNLARNDARWRRRWRWTDASALERLPTDSGHPSVDASPDDLVDDLVAVRACVAELPRRQREVFALRVDFGLPFVEVARALGVSESSAKVHFHLAMKRLRARFTTGVERGAPRAERG